MHEWWRERVVYQIYPRSFQDTNGDGVGDIPGIIKRLDNLKDLGIGIVWLSPVYCSPNEDNGYDISDYLNINPEYGAMSDMDNLIKEAKKRDIKIIMDLVINHTSDQHEWFQKSRDKNSPFRDYYYWRPGKDNKLPNNWTSFFAEDCWEYDKNSGEYYLHLFAKGQPDLNYDNPKVLEEIKNILRFWLDKGIAGFRCDVINVIYKSSLKNGKKRLALTGKEHYISQEGTHEILRTLRKDVFDKYDCFTVGETVFVTPPMAKDLCDIERKELDMVFAFEHMESDQWFVKWFPRKFSPKRFMKTIYKWQESLEWNTNYFENHDQPRSVTRYGDAKNHWETSAKMLATLLFTLRGTPYVYQGQEIGMTNYPFSGLEEIEDIESHNLIKLAKKMHIPSWYRKKMLMRGCRDHARTPVQWDESENAGFTGGKPWLVINRNFKNINMAIQIADGESIRSYYKKLILLRAESDVLKSGAFKPIKMTKHVFAYSRELNGKTITILLNFSEKYRKAKYNGSVVISNYSKAGIPGVLRPYEAVLLK